MTTPVVYAQARVVNNTIFGATNPALSIDCGSGGAAFGVLVTARFEADAGTTYSLVSATIGGVAMTGGTQLQRNNAAHRRSRQFWLSGASVPAGVQPIVVTANNANPKISVEAVVFRDTASSGAAITFSGSVESSITGTNQTRAIVTASTTALAVVVASSDASSTTAGTGGTTLVSWTAGPPMATGVYSAQGTGASVNVTWTDGSSATADAHGISVNGSAGAGGDTTPPTLTGTITQGATTASSIVITWPDGADNVAVTGYEVSSNGGTSYVASNGATATTTSHTFSVLTAGTAYAIRVRAKDAAGNVSTPVLSASFSTSAAGDSTAPVMAGALSVAGIGYRLSWAAASDNVAVTGYEVSLNGGTSYSDVGNVLFFDAANRTPGSTDQVRVRAYDAAGNRPTTVLSGAVQVSTSGAVVATALVIVNLL